MCVNSIYFWFKKFFPEKTHGEADGKRGKADTGEAEGKAKYCDCSFANRDTKVKKGKAHNKKRVQDITIPRRRTKRKAKSRTRKVRKGSHKRNAS